MAQYRVYVLNEMGRIGCPAVLVDSPNDKIAIERAAELLDAFPIEVWDHARCVVRLEPDKRSILSD